MKKKNFKFGEYCVGGIISVQKSKDFVTIQALDYKTKDPVSNKITFLLGNMNSICNELETLTTSYYAEQILNYIKK